MPEITITKDKQPAVVAVEKPPPKRTVKEFYEEKGKVLFRARSVFPFKFFPAEVTIEAAAVNISNQTFFFSKEIASIPLKEVLSAEVHTGLYFAKLTVIDIRYNQEPLSIEYLKKEEAMKARRIIQGLLIAFHEDLSTDGLSIEEQVTYFEKLGRTRANV